MARINTNVAALTAQRGLGKSQKTLSDTLQKLSSGLRINRGADDRQQPARQQRHLDG
jgi:flagellin